MKRIFVLTMDIGNRFIHQYYELSPYNPLIFAMMFFSLFPHPLIFVRGKEDGIQVVIGLKYMNASLIKELKEISEGNLKK
ncbi:MAG: hypothetical protein ACUVWN_07885 [bacterium]